MELLPSIKHGRTSFAAHYDFLDRYIYVIGGADKNGEMMDQCEKFDVFELKWTMMPSLNFKRCNPGILITQCKKYLYSYYGYYNLVKDS